MKCRSKRIFQLKCAGVWVAAVSLATLPQLLAQTGAAAAPARFNSVTVELAPPGNEGSWWSTPRNGDWQATSVEVDTLAGFVLQASHRDQLVGLPAWTRDTRVTIDARFTGPVTTARFHAMLASMLADDFQFAYHVETREVPARALVVANDQANHLKRARAHCSRGGARYNGSGHVEGPPPCGEFVHSTFLLGSFQTDGERSAINTIKGDSVSMADLAAFIAAEGEPSTPVLDKTTISGLFDLTLHYETLTHAAGGAGPPPNACANVQAFHAAFEGALESQFGLSLQPGTLPVPVFVVDHIAPPSQ